MNLLVFNLCMDADDPVLGFATGWVNALARRSERVHVITMRAGRLAVEPNVTVESVGKEAGYSELRRALRFYRLTVRALRTQRPDVCFAHMIPAFVVLFAPLRWIFGVPVVMWYAHSSVTRTLRVATAVCDIAASSTPAGFRLPSRKVRFINQGVDVRRFRPPEDPSTDHRRTVIVVGRLSPSKHVAEVIDAMARVRVREPAARLVVVGGPATSADTEYVAILKERVRARGLEDVVSFTGPVLHERLHERLQRAAVVVNLFDGTLDKSLLEAIAAGCIPVSTNAVFCELAESEGFPQLVAEEGPDSVARRILEAISLEPAARAELSSHLRAAVERRHSLDALVDTLFDLFEEARTGGGTG